MRPRAYRRHQTVTHMRRRLKEDRNQHYDNLDCPCWTDLRAMARFKEQPKAECWCCRNPRHYPGLDNRLTVQERRAFQPDELWNAPDRREAI
jgi:hypothetical protein